MITVSKSYQTRDGKPVRVLGVFPNNKYDNVVIGATFDIEDGLWRSETWCYNGCYYSNHNKSDDDLVEIEEHARNWKRNKPMMVRMTKTDAWRRRHFAHYVEPEGRAFFFNGGKTSFSSNKNSDGKGSSLYYRYWREPTTEELVCTN
tara:strand:+ start:3285 stop:3725 length:441 start_codon:yes stop_codon:yes gene_type:complete